MTDISIQTGILGQSWLSRLRKGFEEALGAQKDRMFLWTPVPLGLGILIYFSLQNEPPLRAGFLLMLLAGCLLLFVYRRESRERGTIGMLSLCGIALLLIASGFMVAQAHVIYGDAHLLAKPIKFADLEGAVRDVEALDTPDTYRVMLRDVTIKELATVETPRSLRLKIKAKTMPRVGDRVLALAALNPPSPPVAPGAFDFQRHAFFEDIGAVGFAYRSEIVASGNEGILATVRRNVAARVKAYMGDSRSVPMTVTMLTGERGSIAKDDNDAMRDSGLAHILSISGMHIGLVAALVFFVSRLAMALSMRVVLNLPIKKIAAVIAFLAALAYTLLVEAPVPTQRSMIMTGLALLAIVIDREPFTLRLVALAALAVLVTSPDSLLGVSFQMSFASVAFLIWVYDEKRPVLSQWYENAGPVRRTVLYFAFIALTTVIATLATAPFGLYHFQTLAVYGVVSNMLAIPLTTFIIMPGVVLAYLLMPLGLEGAGIALTSLGVEGVLRIAHWTAGLGGAVIRTPVWPPEAFACIVMAALILLLWRGKKTVNWVLIGLAALFIFMNRPPDIQISPEGKLWSLRTEGGLKLSSRRTEQYVAENWIRRDGQDPEAGIPLWPSENCDEGGCRFVVKGNKVAFILRHENIPEDCAWADIVIAQVPVKFCRAERVIDLFDVRRNGAYALWLDEQENPRILSDRSTRGQRPWTSY